MSVLNYEIWNDLADGKAVLAKLKDFAVAQGWTNAEYQTSKAWTNTGGGVYGWTAGTEDFLILTSAGFGAQSLQFRIRVFPTSGDALDNTFEIQGHKGATTYGTDSVHPIVKTATVWTINRPWHSLPSSTIPVTWLFGNSKFLMVICKVDDQYTVCIPFGSPDLVDPAETECDFLPWQSSTYGSTQKWYNHNMTIPFDLATTDVIYFDGARKGSTGSVNFVLTNTTGNVTNFKFGSYGLGVRQNNYSLIRPIFKQKIWVQKASDSRYRMVGTSWVYRVWTEGIAIGQKIKYGSDEYLFFPSGDSLVSKIGIAVRIL